jgi:hypothetical protein
MRRRVWRAPLLAAGMLSLAWGVWLGLLRIGWALPLPWPDQLILHGPLMIGGFLGTLIGLERAVGLARSWAYAAPLCSAAGAIMLVLGPPGPTGPLLVAAASAIVTAMFVLILRREPSLFAAAMATGAAAWLIGNTRLWMGTAIYRVVYWWIAFVVLTIAGERLELNRVLRPTRGAQAAFVAAVALLIAGVGLTSQRPETGARLAGVGVIAVSGWLALNDVARRTVRQRGVTRFIAVSLLLGFMWLAVGGAAAIVTGAAEPGLAHDAVLHAIFVGFVVSMIFGHAPVILPAVLGVALPYRPRFYVHLILLHVSVAVRIAGDLIEPPAVWRAWGGLFNAGALLLFIVNSVSSFYANLTTARAGSHARRRFDSRGQAAR